MRTSTSPSHNSTRHWAKRGLASALALAGACGRPQPSPLTPGAEPELRVGLVAGAPSVTLGGDGELFVTDDANGEPIGSIPAGTVWTVVIDTPGVRLVGYAPSTGTVDVTVGAADGIWSSNSSGSVSSRVWNDELTVPWRGLPCRSRSANSSGDPITVTR